MPFKHMLVCPMDQRQEFVLQWMDRDNIIARCSSCQYGYKFSSSRDGIALGDMGPKALDDRD